MELDESVEQEFVRRRDLKKKKSEIRMVLIPEVLDWVFEQGSEGSWQGLFRLQPRCGGPIQGQAFIKC